MKVKHIVRLNANEIGTRLTVRRSPLSTEDNRWADGPNTSSASRAKPVREAVKNTGLATKLSGTVLLVSRSAFI
jgi:hypothetical protein